MIKLESTYDYRTATWSLGKQIRCKTKHKSNWWYRVDRVKDSGDYYEYYYFKAGDANLAPQLLSVWNNERLST